MAFVEQPSAHSLDPSLLATAIPSIPVRTARPTLHLGLPVARPDAHAPTTHASPSAKPDRETTSVYLIADEDDDREALMQSLALCGFRVSAFADAASFYRAFIATRCDVAVIDLVLRGEGALAIAENLRAHLGTGIVVLSPSASMETRLRSLESGADAYLVKPVDVRELAAQMRAIHRRIGYAKAPVQEAPRGSWTLNEGGWVLRDPVGNALQLTTSERALLLCLIRMRGQPVSRDEIISSLGGNPRYADPHRIDVLVNRLRQKAGMVNMTLPLHSVRCRGYAFAIDASPVSC